MKTVMVHRVKRFWRNRHQGSAALLTTIAISAVLIVLFVGITTIATREVRQSIATDQSNRALYAAQAGVEDAVRRLNDDISFANDEETCNESAGGDPVEVGTGTNAAWTCRTIKLESSSIEGRLDKDESVTINLAKAKDAAGSPVKVQYMTLEWNKPDVDANTAQVIGDEVTNAKYLPVSGPGGWGNRAAVMQVTGVWMQKPSPSVNTGLLVGGKVLPVRSILLSPTKTSSGNVTDFSNWKSPSLPESGMTAKCDVVGTYSCLAPADFSGSATDSNTYDLNNIMKTIYSNGNGGATTVSCDVDSCNLILRLQARYAATHFRARFYYNAGGGGTSLTEALVPDGYATIDVTAKSATYYRRVVAKKKLLPTVADGIFDNALFSGGPICKDMAVYKDNRGAPEKKQDPVTGAMNDNDNAGKNSCDI